MTLNISENNYVKNKIFPKKNVALLHLFLCKKHVIPKNKYLIFIKPWLKINKKERKIENLQLTIVIKLFSRVINHNVHNVDQEVCNILTNFIILVNKKNYVQKDLKMIMKKNKLVQMLHKLSMIENYKKFKEHVKKCAVIIPIKLKEN